MSDDVLLTWNPSGSPLTSFYRNGGVVSGVTEPYSLNQTIQANDSYNPVIAEPGVPPDDTFTLSYRRQQGQSYNISIQFAEAVNVNVVN